MARANAFLPDPALTPLAVEAFQDAEYIAREISPEVEVDLKSDIYFDYGDLTHLEGVDDTGGGEEDDVSEGSFEPLQKSYNCRDFGHQMPMSKVLLQGSRFFGDDIRQAYTRIATSRVKNKYEQRIATRVNDTNNYQAGYFAPPGTLWDTATPKIIKDIQDARGKLLGKGQGELVLWLGYDVWRAVSNNSDVLNALRPTSPTGFATTSQLAQLFGVDKVMVAEAKIDGTTSFIWNTKNAGLVVRSLNPSRFTISGMHTFVLRVNGQTLATYNFEDPKKGAHGSEWVKVAITMDPAVVISKYSMYLWNGAVS